MIIQNTKVSQLSKELLEDIEDLHNEIEREEREKEKLQKNIDKDKINLANLIITLYRNDYRK